jgi:glucose-1-phosphate thymidylyltransferase
MKFINASQLEVLANKYAKNGYGAYLKQVLTEQVF